MGQLHLFKNSAVETPAEESKSHDLTPPAVSIKNTFIDGWAVPENDPVMFRSLQHRSDRSSLDFASIVKMSCQGGMEIVGPDRSVTASSKSTSNSTKATAFGGSPATSDREVLPPAALEKLQVRNTFIHFEAATADQRAVQSMPHGMFKECILAEASQGETGYDTPTTTGYDTPTTCPSPSSAMATLLEEELLPCQSLPLSVGALVVVEGLVKVPAFNGRSAVVQGWDEATGRYDILFASTDGCQQAKIKEANLRMILPCP